MSKSHLNQEEQEKLRDAADVIALRCQRFGAQTPAQIAIAVLGLTNIGPSCAADIETVIDSLDLPIAKRVQTGKTISVIAGTSPDNGSKPDRYVEYVAKKPAFDAATVEPPSIDHTEQPQLTTYYERQASRQGKATAAEAALAQTLGPKATTEKEPTMPRPRSEEKAQAVLASAQELRDSGKRLSWRRICTLATERGVQTPANFLAKGQSGEYLRPQIEAIFNATHQPAQDAQEGAATPANDADHLNQELTATQQQLEAARERIRQLEGALSDQPTTPTLPAQAGVDAVLGFLTEGLEQDRADLARIDAEIRQAQADRQAVVAAIVAAETLMERASGEPQAAQLRLVRREDVA